MCWVDRNFILTQIDNTASHVWEILSISIYTRVVLNACDSTCNVTGCMYYTCIEMCVFVCVCGCARVRGGAFASTGPLSRFFFPPANLITSRSNLFIPCRVWTSDCLVEAAWWVLFKVALARLTAVWLSCSSAIANDPACWIEPRGTEAVLVQLTAPLL